MYTQIFVFNVKWQQCNNSSYPHFSFQELQALAAKLETEKKAVEDAAKSLREEKDTVQQ